jgi:hypothetical protein
MLDNINTWLHTNIKSNDEKLLNYTNEACINRNKFYLTQQNRTFSGDSFFEILRKETDLYYFQDQGKYAAVLRG